MEVVSNNDGILEKKEQEVWIFIDQNFRSLYQSQMLIFVMSKK